MIISVDELKKYITTDLADEVLEAKLQALETAIRKYTNNNFQNRNKRIIVNIVNGNLELSGYRYISEDDTIQISGSSYNDGVYTLSTDMNLFDENDVLVTKIEYPSDVKMGVVNLLDWEINKRNKVGVASETISRHSVTYFNMDGDNSLIGYPKSLVGFLKPYMKARF